jgi:DNA-binding transcriptional ArsR family regulator
VPASRKCRERNEWAALARGLRAQPDITDQQVLKALAHPIRVRILDVLSRQDASPSDIAEELHVPIANVSYHVRHLANVGLVRLVREVPRRGAVKHYYRAQTRPWAAACAELLRVRQGMLGTTLDQIAPHVGAAAPEGTLSPREAQLSEVPLRLDERGWRAVASELTAVARRVEDIQKESDSRRSKAPPGSEPIEAELVMVLFEVARAARGDFEAADGDFADGDAERRSGSGHRRPPTREDSRRRASH